MQVVDITGMVTVDVEFIVYTVDGHESLYGRFAMIFEDIEDNIEAEIESILKNKYNNYVGLVDIVISDHLSMLDGESLMKGEKNEI